MKKFLAIFLLLVYGATTSGFSINLHYCCGKLKDVTFSAQKQHTCRPSKDGISKEKKCCDYQQVKAKIQGEQSPVANAIQVFKTSVTLPMYYACNWNAHDAYITFSDSSPPLLAQTPSTPLYIQHCVFRI